MVRMDNLVEAVALEVNGATTTTFRGHELDLKAPWRRLRFTDSLAEHGLWIRDQRQLRSALDERGVDTHADKDWAQLVDHAFSFYVEPTLLVLREPIRADFWVGLDASDTTGADLRPRFSSAFPSGSDSERRVQSCSSDSENGPARLLSQHKTRLCQQTTHIGPVHSGSSARGGGVCGAGARVARYLT